MSVSFLTQGHYIIYMCFDIIFQILLLCSRPMMSHHVTCHVTAMSLKIKIKIKIKIKSRKIDKGKRKMLVFKAFHNNSLKGRKRTWSFIFVKWLLKIYKLELEKQPRKNWVFIRVDKKYYTSKDSLLSKDKKENLGRKKPHLQQ